MHGRKNAWTDRTNAGSQRLHSVFYRQHAEWSTVWLALETRLIRRREIYGDRSPKLFSQ